MFLWGPFNGYKLGNHPKNIEPCAHRARTVRQRPLTDLKCGLNVQYLKIREHPTLRFPIQTKSFLKAIGASSPQNQKAA